MASLNANLPVSDSPTRRWSSNAPIYRQLADWLVEQPLEGQLAEEAQLPSVRRLATEYRINAMTAHRAMQQLVLDDIAETRAGLGMFIKSGARERVRASQREHFLAHDWPSLRQRISRLGLTLKSVALEELLISWG